MDAHQIMGCQLLRSLTELMSGQAEQRSGPRNMLCLPADQQGWSWSAWEALCESHIGHHAYTASAHASRSFSIHSVSMPTISITCMEAAESVKVLSYPNTV